MPRKVTISLFSGNNIVPAAVTIQIDKINPYSVVLRETVDLTNKGEEITVTRFSVNSNGKVTNVNKLPKKLVEEWQKG